MADYQDDEDIFADLYDDDEKADVAPAAQPAAPAPAAVPAAPEVPSAPPAPPSAVPEASYSNVPVKQEQFGFDPAQSGVGYLPDQDQSQGQNSWSGQEPMQNQWGGQQSEEQERPIGTKEDGKMFIGGLNWETTDQSLRDYFSQFGEVTECTVMRDSASGRSRGFGFLTFRDPKCVNTVMVKEHQLDGKLIDPKRAIPREEQERTSKIFVGGVSQEATEHDFKTFFQRFGRVLDATLMMDKDTGRPRGFGFVTFDSEAAVERTLSGPLEILGKMIEVKKAQPRGNMINDDSGAGRGRGRGGNFNNSGGFGGNDMNGGNAGPAGMMMGGGMGGGAPGANMQGMTPNMMAQYWSKMQQYFGMMQQQMMAQQQGGGGSGGMNPQMQQMMMQQMMAQQQQQQQGQGQGQAQQGNGGQGSPYNAAAGSTWEGMYDDVPAPPGMDDGSGGAAYGQNNMGGGGGARGGRGRGGRGFYRGGGRGGAGFQGGMGVTGAPTGPSNAPAGAPTGPKNAGAMGARGAGGYRGGGRGGQRGGYHPYAR